LQPSYAFFKTESAEPPFVGSMLLAESLILLPFFVASLFFIEIPLKFALYVILGGTFNGVYFYCLVRAYRKADFTLVYPIARSAPVFVVTWAAMFLGVFPSGLGFVGIFAVVAGCFLLPFRSFTPGRTGLAFGNYWNRMTLWALATALMTSLYSIFDKLGVSSVPGIWGAVCYLFLEFFISMLVIFLLTHLVDKGKSPLAYFIKKPAKPLITAALCSAGYILVLLAFQTDSKVSYVVGFRQLSIVIGVIFGALFMKEKVTFPRLVGALVIFAGLLLIAVAR